MCLALTWSITNLLRRFPANAYWFDHYHHSDGLDVLFHDSSSIFKFQL